MEDLLVFLTQIEAWHWWVLGIVLISLEMFIPTGHTLWSGIAALIVGSLLWLVPGLSWQLQLHFICRAFDYFYAGVQKILAASR